MPLTFATRKELVFSKQERSFRALLTAKELDSREVPGAAALYDAVALIPDRMALSAP
jgi:hypothetical protein